jgi:hypothetical protein
MHPHSAIKGGKCIRTFEGHKVRSEITFDRDRS